VLDLLSAAVLLSSAALHCRMLRLLLRALPRAVHLLLRHQHLL